MFEKTYGCLSGAKMLQDLEAAVVDYNKLSGEEAAKLQVVDQQLIVVICTPLMKRILENVSGTKL